MRTARRHTHIKVYRRSIGRTCLRCSRSAFVVAIRIELNKMQFPVRYCMDHAIEVGIIKEKI
jgi:hypothetical protein